MTIKELSKQLNRINTKLEMILIFFVMLMVTICTTTLNVGIITYFVLLTAFLLYGNNYILAKQLKKRTKHIVCDDIYFCYKKKSMTMNHNFFLIIRNNTITEFPYEYYQLEKESDLTIQMLAGQDSLNMSGKAYHLFKITS